MNNQSTDKRHLTIIATHLNADFDAIGSMLAAQKLYPESLVVFPGSNEKNLRNFFIKSMVYLFNMVEIKEIDFSKIKRLVLVDTRQKSRIGKLASLLKEPDIEVHIYDHHPRMADDIVPHYNVFQSTGATVTILTDIIRKKKIDITPEEATIMCLGIYEDTGSFTFSSTTEKDFKAAAFLFSKGTNLNTISNLISREISPQQIELLNDMIQGATHYKINGIGVVVTCVSTDRYIPDYAFLVHKMLKMENLNAIFAIARMESKIYIIARSRIPEVDVGSIIHDFGGGGHPYAASVTLKGKTLAETEYMLLAALHKKIRSEQQAINLMSAPPITIEPDVLCNHASKLMIQYNINALLVVEKTDKKGKLYGYISRQVIEKALYHSLEHVPVREYMTTELTSVEPDADIVEIQEKIIGNNQRILPVMENGVILGVITRTDLLNILVHQSRDGSGKLPDPIHKPAPVRTKNVKQFMKERLPESIRDILAEIGNTADKLGLDAYAVGGFVRDLFLYTGNDDIDIVIEGDGIAFAKKYARAVGARVNCYEKFGTAVIVFPDGFKIDVASARLEYYKFPAALPIVEMSSIKLDLFRRDFTINTLAIHLNPGRFGTLIDYFTAQRDIKDKVIRVLHNLSFVEDPTRVFRAIRFEQRFGFKIGKLTAGLIENAVKMNFFKRLSGRRVFSELRQILEEENPTPSILRLRDFDLLKVVHPSIKLDNHLIEILNSVKKVLAWHDLLFLEESYMKWSVFFLVLTSNFDKDAIDEICIRFELKPRNRKLFSTERFDADACVAWLQKNLPVKNSTLYERLSVFKTESILYMMATTKQKMVKKSISHFFSRLRHISISIKGRDLIKIGIKPGPIYREILAAVFNAKLNGDLKTRKDELAFAQHYVSLS